MEGLKFMNELAITIPSILIKQKERLLVCLKELSLELSMTPKVQKELKIFMGKVIPELQNFLMSLIKMNSDEGELDFLNNAIFELFNKCAFYPKRAESFNSISPVRIIMDDKNLAGFLKDNLEILKNSNPSVKESFTKFLKDIISTPTSDKFNEVLAKDFISLSEEASKYSIWNQDLVKAIRGLLELRFNFDYQMLCYNFSKTSDPLWLTATETLIRLGQEALQQERKEANYILELLDEILTTPRDPNRFQLSNDRKSSEIMSTRISQTSSLC